MQAVDEEPTIVLPNRVEMSVEEYYTQFKTTTVVAPNDDNDETLLKKPYDSKSDEDHPDKYQDFLSGDEHGLIGDDQKEKVLSVETSQSTNSPMVKSCVFCEDTSITHDEPMINCSSCNLWVHFKCSGLPPYQLCMYTNSGRKFTCENCVIVGPG